MEVIRINVLNLSPFGRGVAYMSLHICLFCFICYANELFIIVNNDLKIYLVAINKKFEVGGCLLPITIDQRRLFIQLSILDLDR